jgi:hypothetical protein
MKIQLKPRQTPSEKLEHASTNYKPAEHYDYISAREVKTGLSLLMQNLQQGLPNYPDQGSHSSLLINSWAAG